MIVTLPLLRIFLGNAPVTKPKLPMPVIALIFLFVIGCVDGNESRSKHFKAGGAFYGVSPQLSPDGKLLLYARPNDVSSDLFLRDINTLRDTKLTSGNAYECEAAFSPDGRKIAFVREDPKTTFGNLWILDIQSRTEVQLTKSLADEGSPAFSPDGSQVVFWRSVEDLRSRVGARNARELIVIEVADRSEARITNNTVEDVFPKFSPDGSQLAFSRNNEIFTMSIETLDELNFGHGIQPSFLVDGRQIVCVSGKYGREINLIDVQDRTRSIILSSDFQVSYPSITPDRSQLIYYSESLSRFGDIKVTDLQSGQTKSIVGGTEFDLGSDHR